MKMIIEKCFFKNGQEMPSDYKVKSYKELTELLDQVYGRLENQTQQKYVDNQKKS